MKFPVYFQLDSADCGAACLRMICRHYGKNYPPQIVRDLTPVSRNGVSLQSLSKAASKLGFKTNSYNTNYSALEEDITYPCIAHLNTNHFVVIYKASGGFVNIADPAKGIVKLNKDEFMKQWSSGVNGGGVVMTLSPEKKFYESSYPEVRVNMGFILSRLRPYKKLLLVMLGCMLLGTGFQLLLPLLTQTLIDKGISKKDVDIVTLVILGQLVLLLSRSSVEFVKSWMILHIGSRLSMALIYDFLTKLVKLPVSFFEKRIMSDIMQRIGDNYRIENFVTYYFLSALFLVVNFAVFSVILFTYNLNIFLVFIALSSLYFVWISNFLQRRRELDAEKFSSRTESQNNLYQLIRGINEIKLNNSENLEINQWAVLQTKLYNLNIRSLKLSQFQQAGAVIINESRNLFITFLAANYVISGDITLGMMFAIQYIIGQLSIPLEQFAGFMHSAQDSKLSMERLSEIQLAEEEISGNRKLGNAETGNDIELSNICYSYSGSAADAVIKNISIKIPFGTKTAIVGSSGSGKTTLLKLIMGIYAPTAGNISIGGIPIGSLDKNGWRSLCGTVLQDGYIFQDTLKRNIALSESEPDMQKLLLAAGIACILDFVNSLPLKFNTRVGQDGVGLSQGQRQRILIARALYKNPVYVFMDEATNALDTLTEMTVYNNLEKFMNGKTLLIAAHRLSTVKFADLILVLDGGQLVESGSHRELMDKKGYYYRLFNKL